MKKISFTLNFNWANIVLYSFFISYGFYGAITFGSSDEIDSFYSVFQVLNQCLLIIIPLLAFSYIAGLNLEFFDDAFSISSEDIFLFLFFFIFLFFFLFERIDFSLFSDEISYTSTAHGQSIVILFLLENFVTFPSDLSFHYLVQFTSLGLLVGLVIIFAVSKNLAWRNKVLLITTILIIGRLVFIINGGNQSPHPPLHLIPSFIFGSLFGVRDIIFKIGHLFVYSIFLLYFYKLCRDNINHTFSFILTLCVCTLPIAMGMSSDIEHSIWSYYFFVLIMMELTSKNAPNLLRLVCMVSIGALMRQPILLSIIPIIYLSIKEGIGYDFNIKNISKYLFIFSPLLIFSPFLFKNIVFGVPDYQFDLSSIDSDQSGFFFSRIEEAFKSKEVFKNMYSLFPVWWILLIPFAFINWNKWRGELSISFFLLFIALTFLFYSLGPGLWGIPKYQIEITAPFVVIGLVNLVFRLKNQKINKVFLVIILIGLSAMNVVHYINNKVYSSSQSSVIPLNFSDAFSYINSQGLSEFTLSIGSTYGIFPEIMNGYTSSDIFSAHKIYSNQRNYKGEILYSYKDVTSIIDDHQILAVLLGFVGHKNEYIANFISNGWVLTRKFNNGYDNNYDVVIMERKK